MKKKHRNATEWFTNMNIAIYNKNKIALEPIAAIGYIIDSRAKRKGPAGKAGPFCSMIFPKER